METDKGSPNVRRLCSAALLVALVSSVSALAGTPSTDEIDRVVAAVAELDDGGSRQSLQQLDVLIRSTHDRPGLRDHLERQLAGLLGSNAPPAAKLETCRRLESMGSSVSHQALETLLYDPATVEMACYAFSGQFAGDVARALRTTLARVSDPSLLLPLIQAVGERRDPGATEDLIRLTGADDAAVSRAAFESLGRVASPPALEFLQATIAKSRAPVRALACHAYLRCARELPAVGKTTDAIAICVELEGNERAPAVVRRGARLARNELSRNEPPADFDSLPWTPLFDGESFEGWEGNLAMFRIDDEALVAGTLAERIPHNEFLATTREYADFELRLKVKLVGAGSNAGIQLRSRRIPNHHEVRGYQADMGAGVWGSLYDESRRHRMLAVANPAELGKVLDPHDWNDYRIRCIGPRVRLWINGHETVDYTEPLPGIPERGIIALQIHGGGPSEASYKEISIREIP